MPITDVSSTQNATNVRPECQNRRLSPVTFNTLLMQKAHTYPSTTVKKNGAK
jgi:hypothetical protein